MTAGAEKRAARRPQREARHQAREAAVQMLYQWEVGRGSMPDVASGFWTQGSSPSQQISDGHRTFAATLALGVADAVATIDPMIREAAEHWRIERMNVLDRLILRLAIYEFLHEADTPAKVIINEALELARTFSTDESIGFINGILDAVRRSLGRE